jgi:moderate conductance mechanosensitive channel
VFNLLSQIGKELEAEEPYKSAILEPLQILGVERFGESELVIRMMVKTAPLKQWEVGRELRRRIKNRFDEKRIQIPFPPLSSSGEKTAESRCLWLTLCAFFS